MTFRKHFPIFDNQAKLIYLDNAATTQKPGKVIQAVQSFYESGYSSVHRGVYALAEASDRNYEGVRALAAAFLGAGQASEVIFTSGTTAGINLVATSFLKPRLNPGDVVLITALEHHANLLPWQSVCRQKAAELKVIPLSPGGELDLDAFETLLDERVRMLAVSQVSNVLGTILPVQELAARCQEKNIPILVDGAQGAAHIPLALADWGIDFYACSGHKLYGPTGLGLLYGKQDHLESMAPLLTGGDMVRSVGFEFVEYASPPRRFEAGTGNIAGVVGLGAALEFIMDMRNKESAHPLNVPEIHDKLSEVKSLRLLPGPAEKMPIFSFNMDGVHPHDLATYLAGRNIAVRAGHHCAQPLHHHLGVRASLRVSFAPYNLPEEMDRLIEALHAAKAFFS